MALEHGKVWESMLIAGGIVFAFGIILGAFLLAEKFAKAQAAVVLIVVGVILMVIAESAIITVKEQKRK